MLALIITVGLLVILVGFVALVSVAVRRDDPRTRYDRPGCVEVGRNSQEVAGRQ